MIRVCRMFQLQFNYFVSYRLLRLQKSFEQRTTAFFFHILDWNNNHKRQRILQVS